MTSTDRPLRLTLAAAGASAVLALTACGGSGDAEKLQKQGEQLQQQGQQLQRDAAKTAADIKSGKVDAATATKELEQKTKTLEEAAKKTASNALDAAGSQSGVPDAAKQQIKDAQKQLDALTTSTP